MSELDQSRMFVQGFQPELWNTIKNRLAIKFPDHYPDDPYPLADINDAAKFVLHGSTPSVLLSHPVQNPTVATNQSATSAIKTEDLATFLDKFSQTLVNALAPQQPRPTYSGNYGNSLKPENPRCYFCGEEGHYGSSCLVAAQYIKDGKIKRNPEGKIVLPSGLFIPRAIPGITFCDRINEYYKRNL